MASSALAVLSNNDSNAESRALAVSIVKAFIAPAAAAPAAAAPAADAADAAAAPAAGAAPAAASDAPTTRGHATEKWIRYCNQAVDGETVISTHRTIKTNFAPNDVERNHNIVMDKSTGSPALLYNGVRYFSPNSLKIRGRATDSQKLYVLRDGVWKSLYQLAHAEANPVAP